MAGCSCSSGCSADKPIDSRYRRVLYVALILNAIMFAVEFVSSWRSGSTSLLADSIDFFGDAANYAISLAVLGLSTLTRARAAVFKAACMAAFGALVLARAGWQFHSSAVPVATTMGAIGIAALAVNGAVAWMLFRFRSGDANMRSVWICSRNDALGNAAVIFASLGVLGTGRAWPDLIVAAIMALLALTGARNIFLQARSEMMGAQPHLS